MPTTAPDNATAMDALARIEEQQRKSREADARRQAVALETIARETELTRTSRELADVNQLIAQVEADGSGLVARRGSIMAAAAGSMQSRDQAWVQYQNLRAELSNLELTLYVANNRGDRERIMRINGRVAQVSASLDNLEQQSRTLSAELTTLDLEARNLLSQINAKHLQRAKLLSQKAYLRARIDELRAP